MKLFLSTFINKLDKKGRVSVPASFRLALSGQSFQGIVAFRSYKLSAVEGMGIDRMQRLSDSVDQLDLFSETQDDLTATIFADSQMLSLDGDGRIILPSLLLDHAKIKEEVAFVGRGATFQIWNPMLFEEHQKEARQRVQEKQATLKLGGPDES
ncbi:division/cell wall cluster transcriptional repressor MraZ [Kamptonema cortianum]|jgi:MraZ protein|nr:division/cell wall cluster transcriptional repressor MraZ [Geitlerinema splendidum]MDK3161326.1 division/cell wall cluster transcriptional repressor MraZ [Kamptonema cortianum]